MAKYDIYQFHKYAFYSIKQIAVRNTRRGVIRRCR